MEKAESQGGVVVRGRVEIDMRQPFTSVKEAISLFGERVLAGEIYATKLKETKSKVEQEQQQVNSRAVTNELEGTKESNNKENEERNLMAFYLNSLKQELEETKKELQELKTREKYEEPAIINPEIEDLKFVEITPKVEVYKAQTEEEEFELQKKRSVKFANPPLLTRVIVSKDLACAEDAEDLPNPCPSFEKKKKKLPLVPLFGVLFSKKKSAQKIKSKSLKM